CASLSGRTMLVALTSAPRVGWQSVVRNFGLLCGWLVPAYLLPFAALWGYLGVTADYGSPDVLAALAGPVGMSLAVALGCVLGTALPYPVLAPGIGLLVFLLS